MAHEVAGPGDLGEVALSSLDSELFDGAGVTKGDLIDYVDAMSSRLVPVLRDRPLSVVRVRPGQQPFMQKNLPRYAPAWIETASFWAETSKREVRYPLCNDRRTLLWLGNQRCVEFHPQLFRTGAWYQTDLVIDLDPTDAISVEDGFVQAAAVGASVKDVLDDLGLQGAVKTSGSKGLHVFVPLAEGPSMEDVAAASRALAVRVADLAPELATVEFVRDRRAGKVFVDCTRAGGATIVAAYSPRVRPGVPVSYPIDWDDLDEVKSSDFTITNAVSLLGESDPWAEALPSPQTLPSVLVDEGGSIPIARVQAMHEGKRRRRAGKEAGHE